MLELCPIAIKDARRWIDQHHRHHQAPLSALFAVAVTDGEEIKGVATVGRPVARGNQDGWTAEVTRVAVLEDVKNACSMLYAACWRAARAMGYRKIITYTLASEPGTSVKAAGWKVIGQVKAESWSRQSRPRVDRYPLMDKTVWAAS